MNHTDIYRTKEAGQNSQGSRARPGAGRGDDQKVWGLLGIVDTLSGSGGCLSLWIL